MDDVEDRFEPYSERSRTGLREATARLIEQLQRYADEALAMRGGSSELPELYERNDALTDALAAWNDRVFDHTGLDALTLGGIDDEENDEDDQDAEDGDLEELPAIEGQVSIVTRWDLDILDVKALIEGGRAAHRRKESRETEEDAVVAVPEVSEALHAILAEVGEPWFATPGVKPVAGARVFVVPDEPLERISWDAESERNAVLPPAGEVVMYEDWVIAGARGPAPAVGESP